MQTLGERSTVEDMVAKHKNLARTLLTQERKNSIVSYVLPGRAAVGKNGMRMSCGVAVGPGCATGVRTGSIGGKPARTSGEHTNCARCHTPIMSCAGGNPNWRGSR